MKTAIVIFALAYCAVAIDQAFRSSHSSLGDSVTGLTWQQQESRWQKQRPFWLLSIPVVVFAAIWLVNHL